MRPKPPPQYRILIMMATNMPSTLDEALLRPGRIDRIYRVGYPSKAGRIRTYEGYFDKVSHELTAEQIDKLATITPYATGATIKDLVNEALIIAIRDGRDVDHLAGRDQGQAAQGARPARGRRVHRARAARGRGARGLPRGDRLPDPAAHGDRHRHDREGQRLPRHGVVDQAGGPVHPVAQRVRVRHPGGARLAGRASGCSSTATAPRASPATWSPRPPSPPAWRGTGAWARRSPPPPRARRLEAGTPGGPGPPPRRAATEGPPGAAARGPDRGQPGASCSSRPRRSCARTSARARGRARARDAQDAQRRGRHRGHRGRPGPARGRHAVRGRRVHRRAARVPRWRPCARTASTASPTCRCR